MRILELNNNYSPTGGGVKTYHHRKLAYYARQTEHVNALVVPSDHDEVIDDGPVVRYHVKGLALGGSGYRMIVSVARLRKVIEHFQPDVIEVGSVWLMPRLVRRANKRFGAATVGFYHTDVPNTHVATLLHRFGSGFREWAIRKTYRWIGRTYAPMTATFGASEYSLQALAENGVRRLFHTPFGTDTDTYRPSCWSADFRRNLGAEDKTLLLYASRINREKGIDLLMAAYPGFRDPERFQLVIGGHGPFESRLNRFLADYPEVKRMPYLHGKEEVARAFASADVFLSLGAAETFGLAVPEAMACGTPVIAPAAGGAGEQVDKAPAGATFTPRDPAALAAVCAQVVRPSPEQRQALANWVRDHYDWDRTFAKMSGYYARIASAHRAGDLSCLDGGGAWFTE